MLSLNAAISIHVDGSDACLSICFIDLAIILSMIVEQASEGW